ncbi:MAG: DUF1638 domain-containing protein [Bacteroidetes bacterium]|jgi:hypothetical protein|nr:DUF1638 domain-containing protein [Bacteroidota bacterium]
MPIAGTLQWLLKLPKKWSRKNAVRKPQLADRQIRADAAGTPPGGLVLIACGALAREILAITSQFPAGTVELTCLPASWHNHPEKIVPGLRRKVSALRRKGRRVAVIYGDCGTGGEIDAFLEAEQITRIPGPHCYEMFLGAAAFEDEMETALGTFFLTDYMVRHFERIVMQGMGLRRHPQLRDMYFGNYTRALYIAQIEDKDLARRARIAAAALGLDYEYRFSGYGTLPAFIAGEINQQATWPHLNQARHIHTSG